jgi:hypothetical protein
MDPDSTNYTVRNRIENSMLDLTPPKMVFPKYHPHAQ